MTTEEYERMLDDFIAAHKDRIAERLRGTEGEFIKDMDSSVWKRTSFLSNLGFYAGAILFLYFFAFQGKSSSSIDVFVVISIIVGIAVVYFSWKSLKKDVSEMSFHAWTSYKTVLQEYLSECKVAQISCAETTEDAERINTFFQRAINDAGNIVIHY